MVMIQHVGDYTDSEPRCSMKGKTGGTGMILLAN